MKSRTHGVETIEEGSYKELKPLLNKYNISDISNHYYFSNRVTKEWRGR